MRMVIYGGWIIWWIFGYKDDFNLLGINLFFLQEVFFQIERENRILNYVD